MKSIKLFVKKSAAVLFATTIIIGCNTNEAKENTTQSNSEVSVEAPKMPIHTAAYLGDDKVIKAHIAAGTDLNLKDEYGSTPLTVSITFGKTDAALALIKGGADLSAKNNDGSTPLHTAAFFCRKEIVESLLKNGADTEITNNYGATPLLSVSGRFADVLPIYMDLNKNLGPLGLKLDLNRIEKMRPIIADLLRAAE
jgi:hypothetical protein